MCDPGVGKVIEVIQVAIPYNDYMIMVPWEEDNNNIYQTTDAEVRQIEFQQWHAKYDKMKEDHDVLIDLLWETKPQLPTEKYILHGDFVKPLYYTHDASKKFNAINMHRENPIQHDNQWLVLKIAEELIVRPWGLGEFIQRRIVEIHNVVVFDYEPHSIDNFPFNNAYQIDLIPDDTYYSSPLRVSYAKRKKVVDYCTQNNIKFFCSWSSNENRQNTSFAPLDHPYHAPFYASILVENASDAVLCKLKI